jgi:hypothetical protein
MDLLQQGVEQSVIALWLGHETIETTQVYLDADLELKQRVAINPTTSSSPSSRASDKRGHVLSAYPLASLAKRIMTRRDIVPHGT